MPRENRRRERRDRHVSKTNPFPAGLEGGRYKPLSEVDVYRIHDAALRVLEQTGVEVLESECRAIVEQAGARVDRSRNRVFILRGLIEAQLKSVNRDVVLYSKDGQTDLHLRDKRVHLGTGGAAVQVLDIKTGRTRESRLRDLYDIGRLVEKLEHIHFYLRPVVARDMSNEDIDLNTFYACLVATNKHVMGGCYFPQKVTEIKRMGAIIAGSEAAFLE